MNDVRTKICGLTRPQDVAAAAAAGANYLGFNFFPKSPRYLDIPSAGQLALDVPPGIAKVVLVVNPDNALLDAITGGMPLDMIQLHGQESPERVTEIKARYGLPVIKVLGVADAEDLPPLEAYGRVADQLLVDAKPPKNAELPGGNGLTFDWRLIAGRRDARQCGRRHRHDRGDPGRRGQRRGKRAGYQGCRKDGRLCPRRQCAPKRAAQAALGGHGRESLTGLFSPSLA